MVMPSNRTCDSAISNSGVVRSFPDGVSAHVPASHEPKDGNVSGSLPWGLQQIRKLPGDLRFRIVVYATNAFRVVDARRCLKSMGLFVTAECTCHESTERGKLAKGWKERLQFVHDNARSCMTSIL